MTTNKLKHQANLQKWAGAIQECRSSGQSVKQWCLDYGITTTTYYRWERELLGIAGESRNTVQSAGTVTFAQLPAPRQQCCKGSEQAATIHIQDVTVDIYPGMDGELLKTLLEAVRSC